MFKFRPCDRAVLYKFLYRSVVYVKDFLHLAEGFARIFNASKLFNLFWRVFEVVTPTTCSVIHSIIRLSVKRIGLSCSPFKIFNPIVSFVAILMVDLKFMVVRLGGERGEDQSMHPIRPTFTVFAKRDGFIPSCKSWPKNPLFKLSPVDCAVAAFYYGNPCNANYFTARADFVETFKSWNAFSFFHRMELP